MVFLRLYFNHPAGYSRDTAACHVLFDIAVEHGSSGPIRRSENQEGVAGPSRIVMARLLSAGRAIKRPRAQSKEQLPNQRNLTNRKPTISKETTPAATTTTRRTIRSMAAVKT